MSEIVHLHRSDRVLEITIDRPPANAINNEVSALIYEACCLLQDDDALSVGIVTGAGDKIFSAGWDLKEIASKDTSEEALNEALDTPGGFAGLSEFWDLYKPVIAAVNGAAVGGGFEIALAADIIIASEHAEFFLPEMQRGFLPDAGAVQRLPRRIPYNVAMELILTGRRMSASEAKHWGLVHEITPRNGVIDRARELAQHIASGAPLAMQALKEVMPEIYNLPLEEAFAETKPNNPKLPLYQKMLSSEDFMEGARAFTEKRPPVWKAR